MNWNGTFGDPKTNPHDAYYSETDTECIGGDWFAPGQMNVYKYE